MDDAIAGLPAVDLVLGDVMLLGSYKFFVSRLIAMVAKRLIFIGVR